MAGLYGNSMFTFLRNHMLFSTVAAPQVVHKIPISPHSCHPNECEGLSHGGLDLYFSNN